MKIIGKNLGLLSDVFKKQLSQLSSKIIALKERSKAVESKLLNILDNGEKITLIDGSTWRINPDDIPVVSNWVPTATVMVTRVGEDCDTCFPHQLLHIESKVAVRARKEV